MTQFKDISDAMAAAVETANQALVQVHARRRLPATGIVCSADGVIVTAHHVVESDEQITVTTADGNTHEATLIGRDPQNDLAVLQVDATLTPANWGDDDALQVGHLVLALGRAMGDVQASLGVVSGLVNNAVRQERRKKREQRRGRRGKGRGQRRWRMLVDGYIQSDVTMYPGFSGGALVAADGMIYGMNTSGFRQGTSVTVPVATIRNTVSTLRQHGKMKQGYIGVSVQPARLPQTLTDELEQEVGLLVTSVEANSPAIEAGLLVGDILVSLDDDSLEQLDELLALLTGNRIGEQISLQVVRGGQLQELTLTIAERQ